MTTLDQALPQTAAVKQAQPLWYKDALIYELHVRAFYDSDGDGIGDFRGLTSKLDYLRDLGVTALWLLPFYPSPLRDDGYDIADYTGIHPAYGSLRDFKVFIREAHHRGLRVITELVLNHTSDQHPWFQQARRARPGSSTRDFYVWSDTPERYRDARIIFKDFESSNWTWDPVAGAYYWHRFYAHQPDLNYRNPRVLRAVIKVLEFWLKLGVDGVRLDAVPYLVEAEGTHSENLAETHAILKKLRRHIDQHFADRMFLAEANQWPEDAAAYFGAGDECHMAFHFPLMPRLFMGIRQETRFPIIDILAQTPPIPDTCQWALFLRNHDELTLEMVTEEERLYMYRAYARDPDARINLGIRRRLAPLLSNDQRRIELMNGLLFSLPGTPVIYYGDELGMGDNIYLGDRNGVRTPMQWSADRNAGFSPGHPQRLYLPLIVDHEYHHESVHVEAQQQNPHSLLNWMKRLIRLRKRYRAFGQGSLEFLHPSNRKILAFLRHYEDEHILVIANLSRFTQPVELDLAQFQGLTPFELFGRTAFPPIEDHPYPLTLGPHSFFWFALESDHKPSGPIPPTLTIGEHWEELLTGAARAGLEAALPDYLRTRPWFHSRGRRVLGATLVEALALPGGSRMAYLALVRVEFAEGDPHLYVLPLAFATGAQAAALRRDQAGAVIASIQAASGQGERNGVLYDALTSPHYTRALLQTIARRRQLKGAFSAAQGLSAPAHLNVADLIDSVAPTLIPGERNNTALLYADRLILKLFRRIDRGINPDLEIGRFLTERNFPHTSPTVGALEYHQARGEPMTLALLQEFTPNRGTAWEVARAALADYFARVDDDDTPPVTLTIAALMADTEQALPPKVARAIGDFLDTAHLLGRRTAELHLTLGAEPDNPDFAPEPFSALYQRSLYQSMRSLALGALQFLRECRSALPAALHPDIHRLLDQEGGLLERFRTILEHKFSARRIRVHGNYHLEQVLCTDTDLVIIDFEGEPTRPLFERQLKRSPLSDAASMLRSFHYAAAITLAEHQAVTLPDARSAAVRQARFWQYWVSVAFLQSYSATLGDSDLQTVTRAELETLLDVYLIERTLYELEHELHHRPHLVHIPLRDVLAFLQLAA